MTYGFDAQLALGKLGEAALDDYFSRWYTIEHLDLTTEKAVGADRLFVSHDGHQTLVEYKTDFMCHKTGNLVVEIVSVDKDNTPGWALSTMADMLVWWITGTGEVLAIEMHALREALPHWQNNYRKVYIPNRTYNTVGILVPVFEVKQICKWVGSLTSGDGNHTHGGPRQ